MKNEKLRIYIFATCSIIIITLFLIFAYNIDKNRKKSEQAYTLLRLGQKDFNNNKILESFSKLQRAKTIFDNEKDSMGVFEATVYLSIIYDQIGQKRNGYEMLRTLKFIDVPKYEMYSSQYYLRMMAYYLLIFEKDYKKVEYYTKKCIDFTKKKYPNNTSYIKMDMANLVELYITVGDSNKARLLANRLMNENESGSGIYLSQLYYCMGLIHYNENKIKQAYEYFEKGLDYSRRYEAFNNEMNSLIMLAKLDSLSHDMPAYVRHKQSYDSLKSKISGNEIYYQIALMQEQHKREIIQHENKKNRTVYTLVVIILALIPPLMILAFILIYKNIKNKQHIAQMEKQKLTNIIEMERMEKELLKLKIEKKNQLFDKSQKDNIILNLKLVEHGHKKDNLKTFERWLKETDDNFISIIESKYPHLSRNDIKLMSFIKMGMDSHEIASVLNITIESLHKSRYRLRKKLNLEKQQELETFINSIC